MLEKRAYDKYNDGYDYLMNMKMYTLTYENIKDMKEKLDKIQKEIKELKLKSAGDMWIEEL